MKALMLPKKIINFILFVSIAVGAALTLSFAEGEQPENQMESREQLELAKLKQEIKKLELENKKLSGGWGTIVGIAPFLTTIVALLGVLSRCGNIYRNKVDSVTWTERIWNPIEYEDLMKSLTLSSRTLAQKVRPFKQALPSPSKLF